MQQGQFDLPSVENLAALVARGRQLHSQAIGDAFIRLLKPWKGSNRQRLASPTAAERERCLAETA